MRSGVRRFVGVVLGATLCACSGGDGPGPTVKRRTPTPPTDSETSVAPSDTTLAGELSWMVERPPIDVNVTLDATRAATNFVPTTGSSMSVTRADGTAFTLTIPADTLEFDTPITMTPVTAIDGNPFAEGPTYAVQLAPDGLQLYQYATLQIDPAAPIPIEDQLFYEYSGEGGDLGLAIPVVDSEPIQIHLLHFSGYGATKGLSADSERLRKMYGGALESQIRDEVSRLRAQERRNVLDGIESSEPVLTSTEMERLWRAAEAIARRRVEAMRQSCAKAKLATDTVLGLQRQRQLAGFTDPMEPPIGEIVEAKATVCFKEEHELCVEQHIVHRLVEIYPDLVRQLMLAGVSDAEVKAWEDWARPQVRSCVRFEIDFKSSIELEDPSEGAHAWTRARADKVVLELTEGPTDKGWAFTPGKGTLKHEHLDVSDMNTSSECKTEYHRNDSTFEVVHLYWDVEFPDAPPPPPTEPSTDGGAPTTTEATPTTIGKLGMSEAVGKVTDFHLTYVPGHTNDWLTISCPEIGYSWDSPQAAWFTGPYLAIHQDEVAPLPNRGSGESGGPVVAAAVARAAGSSSGRHRCTCPMGSG